MVDVSSVVPPVSLGYLLFDFGRRGAQVDAATAEKLAAGANFIQANQTVAFRVASTFYQLLTQQERLAPAEATSKTPPTPPPAPEFPFPNPTPTPPHVP